MSVLKKIKRAARGDVKLTTLAREALRRSRAAREERKERASLDENKPLRFWRPWDRMTADELLAYFKGPREAKFFDWPIKPDISGIEQRLGKNIEWRRDPLSNYLWPLDYHRDIKLMRADGSDVRVLWELNRLGHFLPLAHAYSSTKDERYATEFFVQLRSWIEQNPYGRGPNWACAMEVALRAMNLLVAFETFRHSPRFNYDHLLLLLRLFQQHGDYICRNLEFSYIATSNHYLSDMIGLLWLGVMLTELEDDEKWRDSGHTAMLQEMDKQVLADGADFEASTGYHRFVTELFLYSFMLCRANDLDIKEKYWTKLHQMLKYVRAYVRPDGFAPLIGDTDSGQVLPFVRYRADDHAYLLEIGAQVFNDPELKTPCTKSQAFPDAGTYIMRDRDLYLCFNASGPGLNGRGSHGHNDALSIEVSAGGRAYIVDPGTYVYSADLEKRHAFRSTSYHSTVQIDGLEQNTIDRDTPFVIGNGAKPRVLEWQTGDDFDKVVGEHYGYPVVHRRTIVFHKRERTWLIDDEFFGEGEHLYEVRFHFAPGMEARELTVRSLNTDIQPVFERQPVSRDYGEMTDAVSACWRISGRPRKLSWEIKVNADNTD